ncbi:MAG TPA: alpha-2-macroglobulin family protein, partial [Armatimonadota bacterium]
SPIIQAEASVWACSGTTTDLGYRSGGLEIVVDKDTLEAGKDASILVTSLTPNRYVLFTAEADDLYDTRLLHLEGTSELVRLPIAERHVPNVFLNATMFSDYQSYQDNKQVVVPPVDRFLKVDVKADKEEHQPGEEGTLTVSAHDNQGRPVSAEVGLGLVDESLYYIQSDLAGDPRQFFYGTKRQQQVQTQSTLQQKAFWQPLVVTEEVRDQDQVRRDLRSGGRDRYLAHNRLSGLGGGGFDGGLGVRGGLSAAAPASRLAVDAEGVMDFSAVVNGPMGDKLEMARAKSAAAKPEQPGGGADAGEPAVQVRSDFRATVFWQPDVTTDRDGKATVKFTYPDSTTSWKATARVAGQTNQFGIGDATTRTQKPLIVRLQAPRFFVAGDKATVSAVINNNTDKPLSVDVHLKAEVGGKEVELGSADPTALGVALVGVSAPDPEPLSSYLPSARVPAHGEARTDWTLALNRAGTIRLTVQGLSRHFPPVGGSDQELTDAMRRDYTIYEHGLDKLVARSGKSRGDGVTVKVPLPKERKQGSTSMVVQVTPSLAVTMLDALPYLIDYPYGCTEQTMSRFLPAAITAKTLKDLGVKPEAVMGRLFGGIEQDYAGKTHPEGAKDLSKLNDMVQQGLARLYDFQHADGGWGWWKEGDTDRFMTAYVAWGLGLAKGAGLDVRGEVLSRGLDYLDKALVDAETDPDLQAWMLHALASNQAAPGSGSSITQFQRTAFDNLWAKRDSLSAYSRALLALCAHAYGDAERAQTLVRNLVNGVKRDTQPDTSVVQEGAQTHEATTRGTAHWGEDSLWWRWCDSGVESTSFVLRALLAIDPKNELVEPVTNWLLQNRRGAQWSNTRDTAITVLAMNDYLKVSGELKNDLEYELQVNGTHVAGKRVTAEEALSAPSRFTVDPALLRDGDNEVVIRRTGVMDHKGPLPAIYYSAEARFTSLEEPVTPVGNQIFARRKYSKLVARPTLLKGVVYDRVPLEDGDHVTSGERVQCVITIEAKNDYEYLMFEDLKPAGLEAVEVRSGESVFARQLKSRAVGEKFGDGQKPGTAVTRPTSQDESDYTGQQRWVYQELRDRKTALFIDKLPEGVWELRYDLRAETPGQFHALPVVGQAMYVPEIRCNGAEVRLTVDDAPAGR